MRLNKSLNFTALFYNIIMALLIWFTLGNQFGFIDLAIVSLTDKTSTEQYFKTGIDGLFFSFFMKLLTWKEMIISDFIGTKTSLWAHISSDSSKKQSK